MRATLLRQHCLKMLGDHFTYDVRVSEKSQIIKRGIYRWVRHPSYTGGDTQVFKHCRNWETCYAAHTGRSIFMSDQRAVSYDPLRGFRSERRAVNTRSCCSNWSLQPNDAGPEVALLVNELSFSADFTYIRNRPVAASNGLLLLIDGAQSG